MCIKRKHPHYFILNVPIPALASLLLIMAALLTGCGSPPLSPANRNHGKSIQEPGENALSAKASTQPPKSLSEAPATGNLELASFKPDFLIEQAGDTTNVSLGSLRLFLPLGWQMEQHISDEGIPQYILADCHSQWENDEIIGHREGYEHEIVITPYRVSQLPVSSLQLAAEIRELFPESILYGIKGTGKTDILMGCWFFGENRRSKEEEYFIFSETSSGAIELFHIKEGNFDVTCHENDIESFWKLIDQKLVLINEGDSIVNRIIKNGQPIEYYYLLNGSTSAPLLMVMQDDSGEIALYGKDSYETSFFDFQPKSMSPKELEVIDINNDGYDDILCRYWLLPPANSTLDFSDPSVFEGYIWDVESNGFVYISGEQMLTEYGEVWEEQRQRQAAAQTGNLIPSDLVSYLSEYLLKGHDEFREIMLPLVSDRELTSEEVIDLAKDNPDIKNDMLSIIAYNGAGVWLKVDADNDGIEDIFLCEYLGGTLGLTTYRLFTGLGNEKYKLTSTHVSIKEEFCFIQWEGKNYLAITTWEFRNKTINGISLECYESGAYLGGTWLAITAKENPDARDIQISYPGKEKYPLLKNALKNPVMQYQSGGQLPPGSAEQEIAAGTASGDLGDAQNIQPGDSGRPSSDASGDAQPDAYSNYNRMCDMDNDSVPEEYKVSLWQTTNYYTVDQLSFETADAGLGEQICQLTADDSSLGIPTNLWVDMTEYGNITYILYEDGLYDFHICGYFISEKDSRKLIQADCHIQTEITPQAISPAARAGY